MSFKRKLPAQFNPLLVEPRPTKDELVEMRRLGQTKLMSSKGSTNDGGTPMTLFSYVHLRAPLPPNINPEIFGNGTRPEAYFLMRRSKDGFVSSTGMFKASFPWATKTEEDIERRYVKANFNASPEETAGNLWIDPKDAITLSMDYHCQLWIEALVDNTKVSPDHRSKAVTPPPPYKATADSTSSESSIPTPIGTRGRGRTRSASPNKKILSPRKSRVARSGVTKDSLLKNESLLPPSEESEPITSVDVTETSTSVTKIEPVEAGDSVAANTEQPELTTTVTDSEIVEDSSLKVEVETSTETKGDTKIESTHVKVELPHNSDIPVFAETPSDMIAQAKAMVAEAMKLEGGADIAITKKRKVEEISTSITVDGDEDVEMDEEQSSKKAKLADDLRKEKLRTRALVGLTVSLTIGAASAIVPYFM